MELQKESLSWHWFFGHEVSGSVLQSVGLFRSKVLADNGFRPDFAEDGSLFGDITYSDFESMHIAACIGDRVMGTVRVTPPQVENVARFVLGKSRYKELIDHLEVRWDRVLEINRLMIDQEVRRLQLGRTLMYAAIALIETILPREEYTIIGSAGNCTKQADFFLKYTDYQRIDGFPDHFSTAFNDHVSFLVYGDPPYGKGREEIELFKSLFSQPQRLVQTGFQVGRGDHVKTGLVFRESKIS